MLKPATHVRRRARRATPTIEQFLFDLDGTITRQEILPEIARAIGVEAEIAELTERTIVTGNLDVWIADLVARLGVPCRSSTARVVDDRLVGLTSVLDKAHVAREFSGPICSIGDGYNDLGLMAAADLGVAYGGVHAPAPGLLEVASHAIFDSKRLCQLLSEW